MKRFVCLAFALLVSGCDLITSAKTIETRDVMVSQQKNRIEIGNHDSSIDVTDTKTETYTQGPCQTGFW